MNVQVNWLAVVLAGASSMLVGYIWYAPSVFGKTWMKLVDMTEKKAKAGMAKAMSQSIIASLITAYIVAHVAYLSNSFFHNSFMQDAVMTAFWLWLGISATTIITHDSFEQRPPKLTLITMGNSLFTLLAMGFIIGWLKP